MAQDGDYVYWDEDGSIFRFFPTEKTLNETFSTVVAQITGSAAKPAGPVYSDGSSFLFAGIPCTTIGTTDSRMGLAGFHRPTDNLERVVIERLEEGVKILLAFLQT